jgi:hypothetical protein
MFKYKDIVLSGYEVHSKGEETEQIQIAGIGIVY